MDEERTPNTPPTIQELRREHFDLVVRAGINEAPMMARALAAAEHYALSSRAPTTIASYQNCWRLVLGKCAAFDQQPLPMLPETAASILATMADDGLSYSYIRSVRSTIRAAHRLKRLPDPTLDPRVAATMRGIGRAIGTLPKHQKTPVLSEDFAAIYAAARAHHNPVHGVQEFAIMAFGFAGALRRSELVGIDISDIDFSEAGAVLRLGASKTDQTAEEPPLFIGRGTDPKTCPVAAIERWLRVTKATDGPLFRRIEGRTISAQRLSTRTIGRIVKRYAACINLTEAELAGHSLRAGFVTSSINQGVPDLVTMRHTRHKFLDSVIPYYRPRRGHHINMTQKVGL